MVIKIVLEDVDVSGLEVTLKLIIVVGKITHKIQNKSNLQKLKKL